MLTATIALSKHYESIQPLILLFVILLCKYSFLKFCSIKLVAKLHALFYENVEFFMVHFRNLFPLFYHFSHNASFIFVRSKIINQFYFDSMASRDNYYKTLGAYSNTDKLLVMTIEEYSPDITDKQHKMFKALLIQGTESSYSLYV